MKVLVFEDDDLIIEKIAENLLELGHEPLLVNDRTSFLNNKFEIENGGFDFILSDYSMPDISFHEVQQIAIALNKPLLVQSGHTRFIHKHQMGKAIDIGELDAKIKEVLLCN